MKTGKIWGTTEPLIVGPNFEVHRLTIMPGMKCSMHVHRQKWNAFFVLKGRLFIDVDKSAEYALIDTTELGAGDQTTVKPGEFHQFRTGEEPCEALEMYYFGALETDIERRGHGGATVSRVVTEIVVQPKPPPPRVGHHDMRLSDLAWLPGFDRDFYKNLSEKGLLDFKRAANGDRLYNFADGAVGGFIAHRLSRQGNERDVAQRVAASVSSRVRARYLSGALGTEADMHLLSYVVSTKRHRGNRKDFEVSDLLLRAEGVEDALVDPNVVEARERRIIPCDRIIEDLYRRWRHLKSDGQK